jgi:hypothetical protein
MGFAGGVAGVATYSTYSLLHQLGRATVEGVRDMDLGDMALQFKQLSAERRKDAERKIDQLMEESGQRPGGAMFNRGQISQLFSEALGVVREGASITEEERNRLLARARKPEDIETIMNKSGKGEAMHAARILTDQTQELIQMQIKMGRSETEARRGAVDFMKGLEALDWLTDKESGKFSPKRAQESFDFLRQLAPTLGEEFTGQFFRQNTKYLRIAKFPLEKQGIALAMFMAEEMGTGAAVGVQRMIQQFQGVSLTAGAMLGQAEVGLTGPVIYKGKGRQKKAYQGEMDPMVRKRLTEDPLGFIDLDVVPMLGEYYEKQRKAEYDKERGRKAPWKERTREEKLAEAERRVADPAEAQRLGNLMLSHGLGREAFAGILLRRQEFKQQWEDVESRTGNMLQVRENTKLSVIGAATAIGNQFQGVLGQTIKTLAPILVPAMGAMSGAMQDVTTVLAAAGRGDVQAMRMVQTGALWDKFKAGDAQKNLEATMDALAGPLAQQAGMAMTAQGNPMGLVILGLGKAASTLKAAAELWTSVGTGLLGLLKAMGFGPKEEPKTPEQKAREDVEKKAKEQHDEQYKREKDLATGRQAYDDFMNKWKKDKKTGRWYQVKDKPSTQDIPQITKLKEDITKAQKQLEVAKEQKQMLDDYLKQQKEENERRKYAIQLGKDEKDQADETEQAKKDRLKLEEKQLDFDERYPKDLPKILPVPEEPKLKFDERWPSVGVPPWLGDAQKGPPKAEGEPQWPMVDPAAIKAAIDSMATQMTQFPAMFRDGGEALMQGGKGAADIIRSSAAESGAAYGNAAASKIASAVANVNINVQHAGIPSGGANPPQAVAA